jgi:hypothetical protein
MPQNGYVGVVHKGCGGRVRGPILGPFGPEAGSFRSERNLKIARRAGQDFVVEIPRWQR